MSFDLIPCNISVKGIGLIDKQLPQLDNYDNIKQKRLKINDSMEEILILENLLNYKELTDIKDFFFANERINATNKTVKMSYGTEKNGIERSSFYDKQFALNLSSRINQFLASQEQDKYELIGINPLIRFIHYHTNGQKLIPHYDSSIRINDSVLTLKSLIIYLSNNCSGLTNFLKDTRIEKKVDSFEKFPILYQQQPVEGLGIIFNHGVFHESDNVINNEKKLILTTEICYKKL